jgi:acyl carrier protein
MVSIEETVLDTLGEVLGQPVAELRAQPVLATHDWDSLAQLEVLAQLEGALGVALDLRAYHDVRTLDDLVELVSTAMSARH